MCSCGTAPGVFQATPKNVVALDMPIGTIEEIVPIENIPSFGMCIATLIPTPCIPKAVAPWMGSPTPAMPTILGVPLLNQECITMCAMGGAIGFTTPATPTVQMGGLAVAAGSTFLAATEAAKKGGAGINKGTMMLDEYGEEFLDFMPSTDWFDDFSSMLDYGSDFMPENPLNDMGGDDVADESGDEAEDYPEDSSEDDYDGWSDDEPTDAPVKFPIKSPSKTANKAPVKATNAVKPKAASPLSKNTPKAATQVNKTPSAPKSAPTTAKIVNQPKVSSKPNVTSNPSNKSKK